MQIDAHTGKNSRCRAIEPQLSASVVNRWNCPEYLTFVDNVQKLLRLFSVKFKTCDYELNCAYFKVAGKLTPEFDMGLRFNRAMCSMLTDYTRLLLGKPNAVSIASLDYLVDQCSSLRVQVVRNHDRWQEWEGQLRKERDEWEACLAASEYKLNLASAELQRIQRRNVDLEAEVQTLHAACDQNDSNKSPDRKRPDSQLADSKAAEELDPAWGRERCRHETSQRSYQDKGHIARSADSCIRADEFCKAYVQVSTRWKDKLHCTSVAAGVGAAITLSMSLCPPWPVRRCTCSTTNAHGSAATYTSAAVSIFAAQCHTDVGNASCAAIGQCARSCTATSLDASARTCVGINKKLLHHTF